MYEKVPISYSFFFHNHFECIYFSSVTVRHNFKYSGINHLSLWNAIKFAKLKVKLKSFNLGITKYIYSRNEKNIDVKKKNIAFFKSRFCGEKKYDFIFDKKTNLQTN